LNNHTKNSHLGRRLVLTLALAGLVSPVLSAMSAPESASALGCVIGPSLSVGAGREGISCPEGSGIGGSNDGTLGGGPGASNCTHSFYASDVPAGFMTFTDNSHYYEVALDFNPSGVRNNLYRTVYVKNGRIVGEIEYLQRSDNTYSLWIKNKTVPGWTTSATFDCVISTRGLLMDTTKDPLPAIPPAIGVTGPGAGGSEPTSTKTSLSSSMTLVPGSTDLFLVRLDVTNADTASTWASLSIDMTDFLIEDFYTVPRDASCPSEGLTEACSVDQIMANSTAVFVMSVRARNSSNLNAVLPITLSSRGYTKSAVSAGGPVVNRLSVVERSYVIARPSA
jgi:hypothetical protein